MVAFNGRGEQNYFKRFGVSKSGELATSCCWTLGGSEINERGVWIHSACKLCHGHQVAGQHSSTEQLQGLVAGLLTALADSALAFLLPRWLWSSSVTTFKPLARTNLI